MKKVLKLIALMTISLAFITSAGFINTTQAHTPDRCFHKHFGGNTKCKRGIVKKRCSNANGDKGRCYQSGSHCYCKLFPKKDKTAEKLLDLGIAIGGAILDKEERKRHRRNRHREDEEEYYE